MVASRVLIVLAFWPVWIWFVERLNDKSDEPLGLLALLTFVVIYNLPSRVNCETDDNERSARRDLKVASALLALYTLANSHLPALIKAAIAVSCLVLVLKGTAGRGKLFAGDWCLIYLSLPLVASLNFYAGYPLRLLSAQFSSAALKLLGMQVSQEGTLLSFQGHLVQIDAPCSGIKMMWLALYLMALFLSYFRVGTGRSCLLMATAVLAAVLTNTIRVILLFLVEMHVVQLPSISDELIHQAIGLTTFALLTLAVGLAACAGKGRTKTFSHTPTTGSVPMTLASMRVLLVMCIIAAGLPFPIKTINKSSHVTKQATRAFPGWPETFEGRSLIALPDGEGKGETFASFPGKLKAFSDGKRIILMRWLTQPTRQLHPASDCYRALGYEIEFQPLVIDSAGKRWSCFSAKQGKNLVFVKERIADENGATWSDASSWYWSAMLGYTQAPWWSITVEDENSEFSGRNKVSETVSGAKSTPETPY